MTQEMCETPGLIEITLLGLKASMPDSYILALSNKKVKVIAGYSEMYFAIKIYGWGA